MPVVNLLNTPGIFLNGQRVTPPRGKSSALLYYLAYQATWVNREDILYLLWPDSPEHRAQTNLRQLLHSLKKLPNLKNLQITATHLKWLVETDTQVFKHHASNKHWEQSIQIYKGPLLKGFRVNGIPEFDSWLELERSDLFRTYHKAVFLFAEELELEKRFEACAEIFESLYHFDPFDEAVLRTYLRYLALSYRQDLALTVYESFKQKLKLEFKAEPEQATKERVDQIRLGNLLSDNTTNLVKAHTLFAPKMPLPATPFIGRETEVNDLTELLNNPNCRLVTVVAAGGMGKTRLAIEVASRLKEKFRDGIGFIPFETVDSSEQMVSAIANALGISFFGKQAPKKQLFHLLKNKFSLLIADNLEHLVHYAGLLAELLENSPGLKILVTSRENLNLQAEWIYDLTGMNLQQNDMQSNDALDLFVQSAKKVRTSFKLSESNVEAANLICLNVGGMPLAIEFATSWLRVLTLQDIVTELSKGLDSLTSSVQDRPRRHHTIRTVFETSWQRLQAVEQKTLKQISVFHGGFTKETAELVADINLPLLLKLCNKSFLQRDDSGRFTQHPLIWQFVREKASAEAFFDLTQESYAVYFASFLQLREKAQEGLEAKEVRDEISIELANILAAWQWMVKHQKEDLLEKSLWSFCEYYRGENRFSEGEALFSRAEQTLPQNSLLRARLLHRLGIFHNMLGTYDKGAALLEESLRISKKHKALWDEAHALFVWCVNRSFKDLLSNDAAASNYRKCAELFRQTNDRYHEARALHNLAQYIEDLVEKERLIRTCVDVFRKEQGYFGLTLALNKLSDFVIEKEGAFAEATLLLEEAIQIERKRYNPFRLIWWLNNYGHAFIYLGNYEEAKVHFKESLNLSKIHYEARGVVSTKGSLFGLGWLAYLQKNHADAEHFLSEVYDLSKRGSTSLEIAYYTNALCCLAMSQGQFDKANHLFQELEVRMSKAKNPTTMWAKIESNRLNNLATVALVQGNAKTARQYLVKALQLTQERTLIIIQQELLLNFAKLLRLESNYKKSTLLLSFLIYYQGATFATKETAQQELETFSQTQRSDELERNNHLSIKEIVTDILKSVSP